MDFDKFIRIEINSRKDIYSERKIIAELDMNLLPFSLLESFNEVRVNCLLGFDDAAIKLASSYVEVLMKFVLIANGVVNEQKAYKELLKEFDNAGNYELLKGFEVLAIDGDDVEFCRQFNSKGLNIRNIELHNKLSTKISEIRKNDDLGLNGMPILDETAKKDIYGLVENTAVGTIIASRLGSSKRIVYLVQNLFLLSLKYKHLLKAI